MSTVTLTPPSQSAYVSYGDSDANLNSYDKLRVGVQSSTSIQYQAMVQFNLSSIDDYSTINSATLKLYSYSDQCYQAETTILAKRITGSWSASTVTYDMRPGTTTTHQASSTVSGYDVWYEWNVKDIVQDWVNGTANYGFYMIQDGLTTSRGKCFKRTGDYAPKLVVDYTPLNVWVHNGTAWQHGKEMYVYDGSAWRRATPGSSVYANGAWRTFI